MEKTDTPQLPAGWVAAGSNPAHYDIKIDTNTSYNDKKSVFISESRKEPSGFVTLMQDFSAKEYHGKRMKFSAFVKSENVSGWAGLWMQVEGAGGDILSFDNMKTRPIKDTIGWTEYAVVLDVPQESKMIGFGLLLSGEGKVWIAGIKFEEVDKETAVTNMQPSLPTKPANLDFAV